jgi:hypothetical protein
MTLMLAPSAARATAIALRATHPRRLMASQPLPEHAGCEGIEPSDLPIRLTIEHCGVRYEPHTQGSSWLRQSRQHRSGFDALR